MLLAALHSTHPADEFSTRARLSWARLSTTATAVSCFHDNSTFPKNHEITNHEQKSIRITKLTLNTLLKTFANILFVFRLRNLSSPSHSAKKHFSSSSSNTPLLQQPHAPARAPPPLKQPRCVQSSVSRTRHPYFNIASYSRTRQHPYFSSSCSRSASAAVITGTPFFAVSLRNDLDF